MRRLTASQARFLAEPMVLQGRPFPTEELAAVLQIVDEWLLPFNQRQCNLILNVALNREGCFAQNAVATASTLAGIRDLRQALRLTPADSLH